MLIYFSFLCLIRNFFKFFLLNCFITITFLLLMSLEKERETDRQTDRETEVYLSSPLDCEFKVFEHPLKARNLPNSPEQHSSSFRHYLEDFY